METTVEGGYALISVGQFANVCAARKDGLISFVALRVWLAAHEMRAKRCTAKGRVHYSTDELARLVRVPAKTAVKALSELVRHGLIDWQPTGICFPEILQDYAVDLAAELGTKPSSPVPVPRYILRALFRHKRPSEVMAAIAHLVRCLFRKGREIFNHGLIKASWVASVFGVGERSVHAARKWLADEKFLIQEPVNQFVLNRWGAKFLVSLKQVARPAPAVRAERKSAPPTIKICTSTITITSNNLESTEFPPKS